MTDCPHLCSIICLSQVMKGGWRCHLCKMREHLGSASSHFITFAQCWDRTGIGTAFPDPELPLLVRSVGFHCLARLDLFKLASKPPRREAPQPHLGAALVLFPFLNTGQHPLTNLSRSPQPSKPPPHSSCWGPSLSSYSTCYVYL